MSDFNNIETVAGAKILDEHTFPLFGLTGLFQRLYVAGKGITVDCVIVSLAEAADKSDEELLNLVVASGYVHEDSDVTFRHNESSGYFYTYFNFSEDSAE
ncbi:hypothetical protein L0B52_06040 [Suttonella sp. R2A3]|uniref:hypothetical protein n=1 Tax=Suttonella sp. R2A3 TaxID=2908648 RepID=UPI001F334A57|nr:hypothetical protein [Suttonella sp. R2A3]UJF23902.1 hypothetical protein L0B52_06040 [Suttonella sp. R2A3]